MRYELQPNVSEVCVCVCANVQCSITEDREHLQVYLRIRPFTAAESEDGESQVKTDPRLNPMASYRFPVCDTNFSRKC